MADKVSYLRLLLPHAHTGCLSNLFSFASLGAKPATSKDVGSARSFAAQAKQAYEKHIWRGFSVVNVNVGTNCSFFLGWGRVSFSGDGEELKNFAILQVFQKHFLSKGKWPPRPAALAF